MEKVRINTSDRIQEVHISIVSWITMQGSSRVRPTYKNGPQDSRFRKFKLCTWLRATYTNRTEPTSPVLYLSKHICSGIWEFRWTKLPTSAHWAPKPRKYDKHVSLVNASHFVGMVQLYRYWPLVRFPPTVVKRDASQNNHQFMFTYYVKNTSDLWVDIPYHSTRQVMTTEAKQTFGKCARAQMFAK